MSNILLSICDLDPILNSLCIYILDKSYTTQYFSIQILDKLNESTGEVLKTAIIIGSGLGSLSTALRLSKNGYKVTILEKNSTAGGRLNYYEENGFRFDIGPSFMSMTYELDELFKSAGYDNPVKMIELDPLYQVFFEGKKNPRRIFKDLKKLAEEFKDIEPDLEIKAEKYLKRGGEFFFDTIDKVVKKNFNNKMEYLFELSKVPFKHIPYLLRTIWQEVDKTFTSQEVKVIFSLVAFFLGSTPFKTPAIYSLLNFTEMKHNGYWSVSGGMYKIVEELLAILKKEGVELEYNTEIIEVVRSRDKVEFIKDRTGKVWKADVFISNADAASFRGKLLNREKYSSNKLDKMNWTLAPFTIYLGVKGKIDNLLLHNYFLGNNFKEYADMIFTAPEIPQKPYYYVNALSKQESSSAPDGCENLFILCPVQDLRYKYDWSDKESFANEIINDLSKRTGFNISDNLIVKKIMSPEDWAEKFNLYKGSGLGLAHNISQVGAYRPNNKDEELNNLYYVGASTTPGTGLPMVIISSKLVTERILNDTTGLS